MIKQKLLVVIFLLITIPSFSQDFWEVIPVPDTCMVGSVIANSNGDILISTKGIEFKNRVFRTLDNGMTWEKVLEIPIRSLTIETDNDIYALEKSPGRDMLKSTDNGETWQTYNVPYYGSNSIIKAFGNDTLFVSQILSNGAALLRSTDGGNTWQKIFETEHHPGESISNIDITSEGKIFIGLMCYFPDMGGIYKSDDYGESWEFLGMAGYQVWDVALDTNNNLLIGVWGNMATWSGGIYQYNDSTGTFLELVYGRTICGVRVNSENEYFAGSNLPPDFLYSEDNITFTPLNSGISNGMPIGDLFLDENQYIYAITPDASNFLARSIQPTVTNSFQIDYGSQFIIYPNPVNQSATIKLSFNKYPKIYYTVTDLLGNIIQSAHIQLNTGEFSVDFSDQKVGVYIITIVSEEKVFTGKIIIN